MAMKLQPKTNGRSSVPASEHYEQAMLDRCQHDTLPGFVRVIRSGGEIFVSSDTTSPLANGIQADMNASANIALRAVMEHDWSGRWWYVLVNGKTHLPVAEKYKGIHVIPDIPLGSAKEENQEQHERQVYAWRAPNTAPLRDARWSSTGSYWKKATEDVARVLQHQFAEGIDKK